MTSALFKVDQNKYCEFLKRLTNVKNGAESHVIIDDDLGIIATYCEAHLCVKHTKRKGMRSIESHYD